MRKSDKPSYSHYLLFIVQADSDFKVCIMNWTGIKLVFMTFLTSDTFKTNVFESVSMILKIRKCYRSKWFLSNLNCYNRKYHFLVGRMQQNTCCYAKLLCDLWAANKRRFHRTNYLYTQFINVYDLNLERGQKNNIFVLRNLVSIKTYCPRFWLDTQASDLNKTISLYRSRETLKIKKSIFLTPPISNYIVFAWLPIWCLDVRLS